MDDDRIYFKPNIPDGGETDGSPDSTRSLDLDDRVTVDLAGFFDEPEEDGPPEKARAAEDPKRAGSRASGRESARRGGSFFGDDGDPSGEEKEKAGSDSGRRASRNARKKSGRVDFRELTERPEFYGAAMLLMGAVLMVIIGAIVAGNLSREKADVVTELSPASGSASAKLGGSEDADLYEVLEVYRGFADYEQNVRDEIKGAPTSAAPEDGDGAETPAETEASPVPAETEAPSQEIYDGGRTVPASGVDYYVFDLSGESAVSRKLAPGEAYASGIGSDTAGELIVGPDGKDLDYGRLRIQNPYNAPGFDLRDVLSTPLVIGKNSGMTSPSVMIYYTHTSEGYCVDPDERNIRTYPSVAGYDTARNVVGRGIVLADAVRARGVGTLNLGDKNDEDYNKAYERSAAVADYALRHNPSVRLALDIHVNTFEYPAGKRYSPVVQADGKPYARILFVVSQNDSLPAWRDNIKLAMLLCEKLNERAPGITLGISLRNEAKYNVSGVDNSLLVEIGFDGNLVEEADNTAALLGGVLGEIYG